MLTTADAKMTGKGKIAEYRERLDETLRSHDLTHGETLKSLVRDQILSSSPEDEHKDYMGSVIQKRTDELSNCLEMLRSTSTNHEGSQSAWKLKQDTEEFRVMYREGPLGSPFHTLLVEGYVDAPVDACLCISWEAALFPSWFPETRVPTFKVAVAECLKRVRICEHISLVRVKLSWPLSDREALAHFFEFEYFKEGLVIAMQTTRDVESIRMEVDGFSKEGIPEPSQTVRVDLVGGFALQKVTDNRSYFRTIINMDIKLDLLPPYLVNFISRQLIGGGFRLYKKTLTSASKDERFLKAMNQPIYSRIRKALYSDSGVEEFDNYIRNMDNNTSSHKGSSIINVNSSFTEFQECEVEEEVGSNSGRVSESSSVYMSAEDSEEYSSEIEVEGKEETAIGESEKLVVESMKQEHSKCTDDAGKVITSNNISRGSRGGKAPNIKKQKKARGVNRALAVLVKAIYVIRKNRMEGQKARIGPPVSSSSPGTKTTLVDDAASTVLRNGSANRLLAGSTSLISVQENPLQASGPAFLGNQLLPAGTLNSTSDIAGDDHTVEAAKPDGGAEKDNTVTHQKKTGGERKKWSLCCLHVVPDRPVLS